ncbi:MAG TPA: stealth family protein [Caulobacteraceae bacterium]|jgi:hypothetical protein
MDAIDAVVTWVDGDDPAHQAKRARWMPDDANANATRALRFRHSEEILYCLRSIRNHAPWVRTIWLVTDEQFPAGLRRRAAAKAGIRVVDHRDIFAGHEDLLPTFSSPSIETMLWRIKGLSDRFLYFNDDVVLTGPVTPGHFFRGSYPLLRGRWLDLSKAPELSHHTHHLLNGARLYHYGRERVFAPRHVVHALHRGTMARVFEEHREKFLRSAGFRFRSDEQIWPIAAHHHYLFRYGAGNQTGVADAVHFSVSRTKTSTPEELAQSLEEVKRPEIVMACFNHVDLLSEKVPDFTDTLEAVTGPPARFERGR